MRALCLGLCGLVAVQCGEAAGLPEETLEQIVDTFAGNVYRRGEATGLAVAITLRGQTYFKSYGYRDFHNQVPGQEVNEHSIFEIGSVTKVWTTALVGETLTGGDTLTLFTALGNLTGPLPGLQPTMQAATLGDLASFSAGFPDVGNTGGNGGRPPISQWGVQDFVQAISALVPTNYNLRRPAPTSLPAPYFYSDWSTGILGLLVTNPLDAPLPANAVDVWYQAVVDRLVTPLGMEDTFLSVPGPGQAPRVVLGYEQPTAEARVKAGGIAGVKMNTPGGRYADGEVATVSISQPGASGATAVAVMDGTAPNRVVRAIRVTNRGTGFREAPLVWFGGPGWGASGQAIVRSGAVVGVQVLSGGSGFTSSPPVYFYGGHGTGASGMGIVSNGRLVGVAMTDGGSGYAGHPSVVISPGSNIVNVVPVWAAAGALKSSASDLVKLCQLYLGSTEIAGSTVPRALSEGAREALLPLVQNAASSPGVFTGMTWQTSTNPIQGGLNLTVSKDGALPGFATYVTLVPAAKLGVVILRSNNQTNAGEYADPIGSVAASIATAIQLELMP